MNLLPAKQFIIKVPFQSTKNKKKELCVDNKVLESIGDVYFPSYRNQKRVYLSTNKTSNFYDRRKCKACSHELNFPFKDQKPTFMLFGGDGTHYFVRKMSSDYDEKLSPLLKKFLHQSQSSIPEPEPKNKQKSFHLWQNRVNSSSVDTVN